MLHLKLILLITSFVLPLALAVMLFLFGGHNLSKRVMAFALINTSLFFLFNYFYFQKVYSVYLPVHFLHICTILWIFPSIYLYAKSIILDAKQFREELFHLLPGAIFTLIYAGLFYGYFSFQDRIFYLTAHQSGVDITTQYFKTVYVLRMVEVVLILAQIIFYSIVILRWTNFYHKKLQDESSNIDKFSINWINGFNLSFALIGLLCIFFFSFIPFNEFNDIILVLFLFFVSGFVWTMGIFSFKQQNVLLNWEEPVLANSAIHEERSLNGDDLLLKKLFDYLEKEKAFLQPDLSLTSVCKELGTNRTYLSSVINQQLEMNYNTFINQYRVQYINEYLERNAHTSKKELAQIGGFGSISSMKRALNKRNFN